MLSVYKYHPNARIPTKAHSTDAGFDLYAVEDMFIPLGATRTVNIGLSVEIPTDHYAKICDRSSMAKKGLIISGGIIDTGFNGEIQVILTNLSHTSGYFENVSGYWINAGDRVAQLIYHKFSNVALAPTTELWISERGNKGTGSSGR